MFDCQSDVTEKRLTFDDLQSVLNNLIKCQTKHALSSKKLKVKDKSRKVKNKIIDPKSDGKKLDDIQTGRILNVNDRRCEYKNCQSIFYIYKGKRSRVEKAHLKVKAICETCGMKLLKTRLNKHKFKCMKELEESSCAMKPNF